MSETISLDNLATEIDTTKGLTVAVSNIIEDLQDVCSKEDMFANGYELMHHLTPLNALVEAISQRLEAERKAVVVLDRQTLQNNKIKAPNKHNGRKPYARS